ncbi:hypothetical protein Q5741_03510 [Paenibacillus sp. JX-17]|uniref:Uncharacterized protein n=1 Tax=Paenibacillus lacisoli TaxID=3064525 RepID=A0ABT9C890_9BACL|nr:hypothetical protein [Paenibacillus sp. JX-17]MDO7905478.1 hypothetical protein [Paenibacillus sp. JX-17]
MSDKNILAYFKSPEEAEAAAMKLKALRVIDMSIDRFSRYPGGSISYGIPVISGNISSLAALTQNGAFSSAIDGILAAADPAASGMSDGGQGGPTGRDILLTVVVNQDVHERALAIVEQCGGMI